MKKTTLIFIVGGACLVAAILYLVLANRPHEKERAAAPAKDAAPGVVLVGDAAAWSGIQAENLKAASNDLDTATIATALPVQDITDVASSLAAAKAQADKATAIADASHRDYQRLQALNADDHNVSDRALQAAEANWRGDEANARAAKVAFDAVSMSARRLWGDILTRSIADNGPLFRSLLDGKEVLLRIALPSGVQLTQPPNAVRVSNDNRRWLTAKLVSASPQTDPHIQGITYFYTVPSDGVVPGMTLAALLPVGGKATGIVLPDAAIVWWQGKPWFYAEVAKGRFVRHELVGGKQTDDGWFVGGFADMKIVVRGAQTLLSEELRQQIKIEEGEE